MNTHDTTRHTQVKSAEIVPSKSYSLQYTLRFPRIRRLRLHDKARRPALTQTLDFTPF